MSRKNTTRDEMPVTRSSKRIRVHSPVHTPIPDESTSDVLALNLGSADVALQGLLASSAAAPLGISSAVHDTPLTAVSSADVSALVKLTTSAVSAAAATEPLVHTEARDSKSAGIALPLPEGIPAVTPSGSFVQSSAANISAPATILGVPAATSVGAVANAAPVSMSAAGNGPSTVEPSIPAAAQELPLSNVQPQLDATESRVADVPVVTDSNGGPEDSVIPAIAPTVPDLGLTASPTGAALGHAGLSESAAGTGASPLLPSILPVAAAATVPGTALVRRVPQPVSGVQPAFKFTGLSYVPEDVIARLQNIAHVREVSANRYALTTVPRAADWGRTPRTEKILCLNGKPLLIWVIGRVRSLWFFDRNGDPHLRVNIGISLHSDEERAAAKELFDHARPRPDSPPETIYAGRICSQREKGEYCHTATAFTHVYDATARLTAKSAMPQLSPVDLANNDIVVIECTFTRWKRPSEGKAKKSWSSYDVGFELSSVFLLHSAPADLDEEEGLQVEEDIAVDL